MTMYRQGDVLIVRVADLPVSTPVKSGKRGVVLAEGEVTGHAHRIASRSAKLYRTEESARYLRVMGPAPREVMRVVPAHRADISIAHDGSDMIDVPERIVVDLVAEPGTAVKLEHEEHVAVEILPGVYRITIHTEYVPGELPRQVQD